MTGGDEVREALFEALGEEGCGVVCDDAAIIEDADGYSLNLCGFLEPWRLGKTPAEAASRLRELSAMGFGMR